MRFVEYSILDTSKILLKITSNNKRKTMCIDDCDSQMSHFTSFFFIGATVYIIFILYCLLSSC